MKFFFCALFLTFSVFGEDNPYIVKDVSIQKTGKSSKEAREKALVQAQIEAFNILIERMLPDAELNKIPKSFQDSNVSSLIKKFSIDSEKTTSNTYSAILRYEFEPDLVKSVFEQYEVNYVENFIPDMLILPILVKDAAPQLWEEGNIWMEEWKHRNNVKTRLPYKIPLNDFVDLSIINSQEAFSGQRDKLDRLADKYSVKDIMICVFHLHNEYINIDIIYHGNKVFNIPSLIKKGPLNSDLLKTIKNETILAIWKAWKNKGSLISNQFDELLCLVETPNIATWKDIKDKLAGVRLIKESKLISLSKGRSEISLKFSNTLDALMEELYGAGLELNHQENNCLLRLK